LSKRNNLRCPDLICRIRENKAPGIQGKETSKHCKGTEGKRIMKNFIFYNKIREIGDFGIIFKHSRLFGGR